MPDYDLMIRNGSISSSVVYAFVLAPRKAGKFQIPAIETAGAAPSVSLPQPH